MLNEAALDGDFQFTLTALNEAVGAFLESQKSEGLAVPPQK